ncbi:cation:proton antiporter [Chloroflexota bacterium]
MQDIAATIALVGILVFLAHLFTGIFSRTKIPDILLLILIGVCFGPVLNLVSPSQFGIVGPVFTTITLIIILFESGLSLRLSSLRSAFGGAIRLAPVSFFLTMLITTCIGIWLIGLEVVPALILGAIVSSTSEAVVIPLVRQLKVQEETRSLLLVESSINDVLSIVITVALVEAYKLGDFSVAIIFGDLIAAFIVALVIGIVAAIIWSSVLNKVHAIKNTMFTTPAFVFLIYGVVEIIGFSGAISALAFGITIGNIKSIRFPFFKKSVSQDPVGLNETEKVFFSEIAFLLKTFFFIYLGISLELISNWFIILALIITVIAFIIRILAVKVSLKQSIPLLDMSIASIMIPKGLAAVVLASIPLQQQMAGGETIKNITYGVILISIVITSLLVLLIEKTKISGLYGWVLSSRFPRWSPQVVSDSGSTTSSAKGIKPVGDMLFKGHSNKDSENRGK